MIELAPSREVLLVLGPVVIRWYGALYVVGFLLAWQLLPRLQHWRHLVLSHEQWLTAITATAASVVIGGRIGYVLVYEPSYFLAHPAEAFAIWQGGMSLHGGLIGVLVTTSILARTWRISLLRLLDLTVIPAALGIAVGRSGNIINGELFATPAIQATAVGKNLLIAVICYLHLRTSQHKQPGATAALFAILYGTARFLIEFVRLPTAAPIGLFTRGQLLSLLLIAAGATLYAILALRSTIPNATEHGQLPTNTDETSRN